MMNLPNIQERYKDAVNSFIERIRDDPNVIAVIVCGSLSYDTVWEKSDVDMTVIVRDQKLVNRSYCILEDEIVFNVFLIPRSDFRRNMEKAVSGSFTHSYFSKGQIVYTTDESLYEYFEELKQPGEKDIELSMLSCACNLVYFLEKSEKWLTVKQDLLYSQYYIAKAASVIAEMEVLLHGEIPTREAILRAKQLNAELISFFYNDALACHWSRERVMEAIRRLDSYIEENIPRFVGPVMEFLSDGEIKTISQIAERLRMSAPEMVELMNYLSEKGVVEKVSKTIRITPKSRLAVEEAAYLYTGGMFDGNM